MKTTVLLLSILFPFAPTTTSPRQHNDDEGIVGFGNQFYDKCVSAESSKRLHRSHSMASEPRAL